MNNWLGKRFNKIVLFTIMLIILTILLTTKIISEKEMQNIKDINYITFTNTIHKTLKQLIQNKYEENIFIALSLANDSSLIDALNKNDHTLLRFDDFSSKLKQNTLIKNAWFQIIDTDGNSFYRSWTSKRGDYMLNARVDIEKLIKKPDILSTISTGKFDMTLKSMVPIYDGDKFLGIFEIITHFNSIAKKMLEYEVDTIFLVDKSYKEQLTKPFSKIFIDEYYVALLEPNKFLLDILKEKGVEYYINNKGKYIIDSKNNYFITIYHIPDIDGNPMGYGVIFKPLDKFSMHKIDYVKNNLIFIMVIFILIIIIIGYFIINKEHQKNIILQHEEHQKAIEENTKFSTIGQMAAGITHEINTPLTYIKGTLEISRLDLENISDNEYKTRLLEDNTQMADGIKRISTIIESMREMAQVTPSIREKTNIYSTIIIVLRMIYNHSKHISKIYINDELFKIENSNKEKYSYIANVHSQRIEQVWTILLNNALDELIKVDDYEKRRVDINISQIDNKIVVSFQDNGGGVSIDIIDKIFEPFISNKESSGIGIGLNVAKKILDEHNASIDVKNINNGASFTVSLNK